MFIHDEFLSLSKQESFFSFFTRNPVDLGSANTTILVVSFFERLYYALAYNFGLSLSTVQIIIYFLKIFFSIFLPYLGFRKLFNLFTTEDNDFITFVVSLWYSFNTYTLIYWNGNAFSLTLLASYVLAPLALYYYHQVIFGSQTAVAKLKTVLLFFLMSFALYFFAVFLLLLVIYTLLYALLKKVKLAVVLKNLLRLALLYLPFMTIHSLIIYDMFINVSKTVNLTGNETYGSLQGGFLYPFLSWFSWAIYTYWEPKNIFTFSEYFKLTPSIVAPFVIYGLIIWGIIKKKKNAYIIIFTSLLLFLLMFVKGGQKPFGDLYLFLINNFSWFRIFRSPDNKFGFGIVFVLTALLLLVSKEYNKKIFVGLLATVVLIQGYPLFKGIAIVGENTATSSDRIIRVTKDYRTMADFLNKNSAPYGYVLGFPSVEFGHYLLGENEKQIGQDLLPKLIRLPFVYLSKSSGMLSNTYEKLSGLLKNKNIKELKEFPIRYFIIRNDVDYRIYEKVNPDLKKSLAKEFKLMFKNDLFEVYENSTALPIIKSDNISFEMINPVKYRLSFKNLAKEQDLYFYQNYSPNWKLYLQPSANDLQCAEFKVHRLYKVKECAEEKSFLDLDDLAYIWRRPVFDATHELHNGYANSWKISPADIRKDFGPNYFKANPNGGIDVELLLYFKPQSYFYAGMIVSGAAVAGYLSYLFWDFIKRRKKNG